MQAYHSYEDLPRELKYEFNRIFAAPDEARFFFVDMHDDRWLSELGESLTAEYEIQHGGTDSPFFYMIVY